MSGHKRQFKLFRWFISLILFLLFFYLTEDEAIEEIKHSEPPVLYSNVCHDNLETIFCSAIQEAKHSILLIIYSLSDTKIIRALNDRANLGIAVKVIYDMSTPNYGFRKLTNKIDSQGVKISGLMHQKILVIDGQKVLLGSANFTTESLKLHDNLVIGLVNEQLSQAIETQKSFLLFSVGGQQMEYWDFPQQGKEGLKRLIQLIDEAKISIRIAMFTWTHQALTEAVIRAYQRGVHIEIVLDYGQGNGVCRQMIAKLLEAEIPVCFSSGLGLLHHKFAWIDETYLVNGSANWTQAAFNRNRDCLLILHQLTRIQNAKMKKLWKKTKILSNPVTYQEAA